MSDKKKNIRQMDKEIDEARSAYQEAAEQDQSSAKNLRELSDKVTNLQSAKNAALAEGAKKCAVCGTMPIGMKKTRGLYVCGCLVCVNRSGEGEEAEEAVEAWNELQTEKDDTAKGRDEELAD